MDIFTQVTTAVLAVLLLLLSIYAFSITRRRKPPGYVKSCGRI